MSEAFLDAFGVDVDHARRAASFFDKFARWALEAGDNEFRKAEAASAFRVAGQWAMTFDRSRARRLLTSSGQIWLELGHGFGAFLLATTQASRLDPARVRRSIETMYRHVRDAAGEVPAILLVPQQQAYWALAGVMLDDRETHVLVRRLAGLPENQRGVLPIGAAGVPVRAYWTAAAAMATGRAGPAFDAIETIALRHADQVGLARSNSYLWGQGAAPVDVVDVDLLGITKAALDRFDDRQAQSRFAGIADRLPAIGRQELQLVRRIGRDFQSPSDPDRDPGISSAAREPDDVEEPREGPPRPVPGREGASDLVYEDPSDTPDDQEPRKPRDGRDGR